MKKIGVTYGVHGDERSSILLAKKLQQLTLPKTEIDIHGPINKEAWYQGKRYIDNDLNRIFDESGTGYEATLVDPLVSLLSQYDLLIDIHTFRMQSLLTSVNFGYNDYASSLPVDIVWDVDNKEKYDGTLATRMEREGVPTLVLELSSINVIDQRQIDRAEHAIRTFIHSFPKTQRKIRNQHFERKLLETNKAGVFTPTAKLMSYVDKGTVLGKIHESLTETHIIKAPCEGTLMQIRHKGWIPRKGSVAAIGRPKNGE